MNSLRRRIVALTALVALLSTAVCALAASRSALSGLTNQEDQRAALAVEAVRQQLLQQFERLGHEVGSYATWSELYEQMPMPKAEWAAINLAPGRNAGALVQALACCDHGEVLSRYHAGSLRDQRPDEQDPAYPRALAALLGGGKPVAGIAVLGGHPALYAVSPIMRSDRSGAARGELVGLAYLTPALTGQLLVPGWTVEVESRSGGGAGAPGKPLVIGAPVISRTHDDLTVAMTVPTHDGTILLSLRSSRQAGQTLAAQTEIAIYAAGLGVAVIAIALGSLLGWYWLRPIILLAEVCRRRATDPLLELPAISGLREAEVLAEGLATLITIERASRDALAEALDRETTANAVHQRFLAQLAHEFGLPIRNLIAIIDRLDAQGGRLEPEQLAAARATALQLEERFHEVLGLAADFADHATANPQLRLDQYLEGVAGQLRLVAERKGLRLEVEAGQQVLPIDARLLTPILINLAANAVRATASGTVKLDVILDREHGESVWTVSDTGPGIATELAERITSACQRGEVLPGEPGIGLGLALALANARALGGRLRLSANGSGGATFEVRLPLRGETATFRRGRRRDGDSTWTTAPGHPPGA